MNIHEAAQKAKAEGNAMRYGSGIFKDLRFMPTEGEDGIIMVNLRDNTAHRNWNPRLSDLLRTDWEVVELPGNKYRLAK